MKSITKGVCACVFLMPPKAAESWTTFFLSQRESKKCLLKWFL